MRLLLLIFCMFSLSFAEVIQSVKVNNMTYMSESLAKDIINIKSGEKLDYGKVDTAILALYKQGYFNDIYATFDNGVLQFFVKEKPAIASIELKGYGTQSEKRQFMDSLGSKRAIPMMI